MSKLQEVMKVLTKAIDDSAADDDVYLNRYSADQIMEHAAEEMSECACKLSKLHRIRNNGVDAVSSEALVMSDMEEELQDAFILALYLMAKLDIAEEISEIHREKASGFLKRLK